MDDLEFVRRCTQGDKQAWAQFIERYSRLIYSYIHNILRLKNQHSVLQQDIDDIFQDIFVLLSKENFKKLKTYRGTNGCSLASWLRQVVIHASIDYLRRVKPLVSLDAEYDGQSPLQDIIKDGKDLASEAMLTQEQLAYLKECISQLEIDDKYFLDLYLNQQLGLEDLKRIFKVPRGTVDMRKFRIMERLKKCFKTKGYALDF